MGPPPRTHEPTGLHVVSSRTPTGGTRINFTTGSGGTSTLTFTVKVDPSGKVVFQRNQTIQVLAGPAVIVDLRKELATPAYYRIDADPPIDPDMRQALDLVFKDLNDPSATQNLNQDWQKLIEQLRANSKRTPFGDEAQRLTQTKGDTIDVYVVTDSSAAKAPQITSNEVRRSSLLIQEIAVVSGVSAFAANANVAVAPLAPPYQMVRKPIVLAARRAQLTITIDPDGTGKNSVKPVLLTGPQESLFLAAEIPLNTVKFSGGGVTPSQKPKNFNLGLYYQPFWDVEDDRPSLHWPPSDLYRAYRLVVVKASVAFSSTPFATSSAGVGIRLPAFGGKADWLSFLSGVVITRNVMWVEGDRPAAGGGTELFHQRDWVYMIGYDLMKVKDWFK